MGRAPTIALAVKHVSYCLLDLLGRERLVEHRHPGDERARPAGRRRSETPTRTGASPLAICVWISSASRAPLIFGITMSVTTRSI